MDTVKLSRGHYRRGMRWSVPRANKAPSGSPALSRSTGLNASASAAASSLQMVFMVASPLLPLLFLCSAICVLACWLTVMVNAAFMWAASGAASLLHSNVFRARSARQIMFFVMRATILALLGFYSTSPSSESTRSELSDVPAPLPQRVAFIAQYQPQPQPSPRISYGGEAEEAIRCMEMECEP